MFAAIIQIDVCVIVIPKRGLPSEEFKVRVC